MASRLSIYGVMAEFDKPALLVEAAHRAHQAGYRKMDAYSPYPVEGLAEAIGYHKTAMPLVMFIGGVVGCISGFCMQYWCAVISYPINVGGRPLNSWPSWIPITFEMTILLSALAGIFGLLGLCGLPMPYHPVFNVARFALASRDRFFLCIEATDPLFDRERTRQFLTELQPRAVEEVAP
jgi:hypothetical protein